MRKRVTTILKNPFFIIIILTLISSCVLFSKSIFIGGDLYFHLSRIAFIKNKILSFNITSMYYFYGFNYGEGLFYPDIFLHIPAIFYLFTDNLVLAYKLCLLLINFFAILSMYYSINKLTNSKKIGIICAAIYAFLPYRLNTLYERSSLGESIVFIFLPFVIYTFLELIKGKKKMYIYLALSMSSVILSHLISAAILVLFLLIIFLFNFKRVINNRKILLDLLYSVIITILLTAFFIFPMIEQLLDSKFYLIYVGTDVPIYNRALSIINIFTEFNFFISSKYYNPSGIGIVLSLVLLIFIVNFRKTKKDTKFILILSFIALLMTTNLFPWELLEKYVKILQFPWRLLTVTTTLSIFGTGLLIKDIGICTIDLKKIILLISMLVLSMVITCIGLSKNDYILDDVLNSQHIYSIAWGEYLPIECPSNYILYDNTYIIKTNELIINSVKDFKYNIYFDKKNKYIVDFYDNKLENNFVELPVIYYKGYNIKVNGINQNLFKTKSGLIGFYLKEDSGKIIVSYDGTFIQKFSMIISILSLIFLLIIKLKKVW